MALITHCFVDALQLPHGRIAAASRTQPTGRMRFRQHLDFMVFWLCTRHHHGYVKGADATAGLRDHYQAGEMVVHSISIVGAN